MMPYLYKKMKSSEKKVAQLSSIQDFWNKNLKDREDVKESDGSFWDILK